MEEQACKRADLRVGVPQTTYWSVNDDGTADWYETEGGADTKYPEGYYCDNCCQWFTPADDSSEASMREAWRTALAHVGSDVVSGK